MAGPLLEDGASASLVEEGAPAPLVEEGVLRACHETISLVDKGKLGLRLSVVSV
jgi:hypothetical protein